MRTLMFLLVISLSFSWLNTSFDVRRPININYSGYIRDVQVLLNITYDTDMQPDFSDLRFSYPTGSGENEIPYWIENKVNGNYAEVWVRVPLLYPNTTIYMYYKNNTPINPASNGTQTFFLFDDFKGASLSPIWTPDPGLTPTFTGDEVKIDQGLGAAANVGFNLEKGYVSETRFKVEATGSSYSGTFATPMSSQFTGGSNFNADATVLYMTASGTNTRPFHFIGDGCSTGYNIHAAYVPPSSPTPLTLGQYYIASTELIPAGNKNGSVIKLYLNRKLLAADSAKDIFCKNFNWIRIGFFSRSTPAGGYSSRTAYDWVLVRKSYEPQLLNYAVGGEEIIDFVDVNIISPPNNAFVSSSLTVNFSVNNYNGSDVFLYLDSVLVANWTGASPGSFSYTLTLTPGTHTITVFSNTSTGQNDSASVNVIVLDTPAPPDVNVNVDCPSGRALAKEVWSYSNRTLTEDMLEQTLPLLSNISKDIESILSTLSAINSSVVTANNIAEERELKAAGEREEIKAQIEECKKAIAKMEDQQEQDSAEVKKAQEQIKGIGEKIDALSKKEGPKIPDYTPFFIATIALLIVLTALTLWNSYKIKKRY